MTNVANKKQMPAFLVLTIISLVAAIALALTNAVTKGPIAEYKAEKLREAFEKVLPAASYEELEIPAGHKAVSGLYAAKDDAGATLGYTVVAAAAGYGGDVEVVLGIGGDGKVAGVNIGASNFKETSGFGSKWKDETDRWEQFKSIDTAAADNTIEAIAGATVTSKAVLNATNAAINGYNAYQGVEARNVVALGEPKGPEMVSLSGPLHEGSAKGFSSDVRVQLQMEDGVISALAIDASGETAGFGQNAMNPEFYEQFIGKAAPVAYGEGVEALSGATITSNAVIEAINQACASPANPDAVPFGSGAEDTAEDAAEDAVEVNAEPVPEGTLTASAPGFMGNDVTVTVTLNEDGTIATLEIDTTKQMAPNGEFVQDEAFIGQFIGKVGPFVIGEGIDGVSEATFTATGVVDALNSLFVESDALTASAPGFMGNEVTVTVTLNEDGTIATLDIDTSKQVAPNGEFVQDEAFIGQFIGKAGPFVIGEGIDGVSEATFTATGVVDALNSLFVESDALTASAPGFGGQDVVVNVTLNEDGTIATLEIDTSKQVAPNGEFVQGEAFIGQFIGKAGPFVIGEGIDGVSEATFTATGVVEALNSLFPAEAPAEEAPAEEFAPETPADALTASAPGFMGNDVTVTVTLNEDGTIATLEIDTSKQVAPNGEFVQDEAFIGQFIGKAGPFVIGEGIDGVSEATFTATGVVDALNSLFPAEAPVEESAESSPEASASADTLTASAPGFGGQDVVVNVTLNADGSIATLEIDASTQTASIGTRVVDEPEFIEQFIGKTAPFEAGVNVDALTNATVTSKAVIEAVNAACATAAAPAAESSPEASASADILTASAPGFGGQDVVVRVTLNEDGVIATLDIDVSKQLPPVCDLVLDESFTSQFIGKAGPFVAGEGVDIVSGATFTSNGVIEALNSLFPSVENLTATAPGFQGKDVGVSVTLDENGAIATLDIDVSQQLPPICDYVLDEAFIGQFIGKKGPFVAGQGVDVVSGATFTSNGVIEALNSLFPAETLTAAARGFSSDVAVTVTLAEDGSVATLAIDASGETANFGQNAMKPEFTQQFIGQTAPFAYGEGVEALSGATITSNAVLKALNSLFELTATAPGFQGADVGVSVTLDENGTIATLDIDVSQQLPPICDYVLDEAFIGQFIGKTGPFVVGEGVDIVSGATYTSNGVIEALNSLFAAE